MTSKKVTKEHKFLSFNYLINDFYFDNIKHACFDSRVFTIPDAIEVENYFVWRQKDAVRNSIQMLAQSLYSHKELQNKSSNKLQEMCFQKGVNWNDAPIGFKRGRLVRKITIGVLNSSEIYSKWGIIECFDFLKEREILTNLIPKYT